MATQGRNRRSEATRQRLLSTTQRLLVDGREVTTLTVNEICIEADVSPSSMYNLFASKEELLDELHRQFQTEVREAVARTAVEREWTNLAPRELVVGVLTRFLEYLRAHEALVVAMLQLRRGSAELSAAHLRNESETNELARNLILAAMDRADDAELARRADVIILVAVAAVQRLFVSHNPLDNLLEMDEEEFLGRLADMILAYLQTPSDGSSRLD